MKRVWEPRSEIRAKTVKTRVLGSSLSSSLPSSAILVSERSHKIFQIFVHIYADFFPPKEKLNAEWEKKRGYKAFLSSDLLVWVKELYSVNNQKSLAWMPLHTVSIK
ncbi:unnamed protein product, partial [Porites lobata]